MQIMQKDLAESCEAWRKLRQILKGKNSHEFQIWCAFRGFKTFLEEFVIFRDLFIKMQIFPTVRVELFYCTNHT